jgi:hypothetical protein
LRKSSISFLFFCLDVVVFDNTFSILRPKKVRYYVAVDPPGSPTTAVVEWEIKVHIHKCSMPFQNQIQIFFYQSK